MNGAIAYVIGFIKRLNAIWHSTRAVVHVASALSRTSIFIDIITSSDNSSFTSLRLRRCSRERNGRLNRAEVLFVAVMCKVRYMIYQPVAFRLLRHTGN